MRYACMRITGEGPQKRMFLAAISILLASLRQVRPGHHHPGGEDTEA